jgi:hypothetical protein
MPRPGPPVHPVERHPGSRGGPAIHVRVVAHVHRVSRCHPERVEGHVEDPRIGLGEAASLGGDDGVEERVEPRRPEARSLHAVDAVRDHPQAEALRQPREDGPAARQAFAAGGQAIEEGLPEARRPPGIAIHVDQELAEALACEVLLPDRSTPVLVPEGVVDPPVGSESGARAGKAEVGEGGAEGRPLGPVEVEKGVVDVEENGAESGQAGFFGRRVTWRGR